MTFTLRWNETNTGLPVKFVTVPLPIQPIIDKNNENLSDTLVTGLELRTHPVSWWESVLRGGRYFNINKFVDLPDPGFPCAFAVCEFPQRLAVERYELEWLNHFHVQKWSTSTFGLEYRRDVRFRITPPAYTNRPPYDGPLPKDGIAGLPGTVVQVWATRS